MANPAPSRLQLIIEALDRATGPLRRLGERLREFRRASGLDKLGKSFKDVGGAANRVVGEIGKLVALGAGVAVGIGAIINKATEAGDALGNSAERAKLTVSAYSELGFAAAKAGIPAEKFADAIDTLNKNIGEAKLGKGKLSSFLKDVSPNLLRQLKAARGNEGALNVLAGAFDRISDSGKRAALAGKVFGDTKFAQFFAGGAKSIKEAREEFRKLDDGASQRFVDGAKEMDNELDSLTGTITVLGRGVMAELFPAFVKLARIFNRFLVDNKDAIKAWAKAFGEKLMKFADELPAKLKRISEKFSEMKTKLEPLAKRVGGFGNLLGILAGLIVGGPLLAAIASLAASFVALGIAIATTPIGWFLLAVTAIATAASLIYANWEPIVGFFDQLWSDVKGIFQGFLDFVTGVFTADFERWWEGFKGSFFSVAGVVDKLSRLTPSALGQSLTRATAQAVSGEQIGLGSPPLQRPMLGAEAARPRAQGAAASSSVTNNAKVEIEVKAPRGTRVKLPPGSTAEMSLNVGYIPEFQR